MANSTFEILEFRAVVKPDWTELFIRTGPASDGMIGVGGWYKKIVPPAMPALDVLKQAFASSEYLTDWDRGSPTEYSPTTPAE